MSNITFQDSSEGDDNGIRSIPQRLFENVLTEKQCFALERSIFNKAMRTTHEENTHFEKAYKDLCYEVYGRLIAVQCKSKELNLVRRELISDKTQFETLVFEEIKKELEKKDECYDLTLDVEEGTETCGKCGCKRILIYQAQTRSSDEGFTNFHTCIRCKNKWKS